MIIVLIMAIALTGAAFQVAPSLYILPFCVIPLVATRNWWGFVLVAYAWAQVLGILPRALQLWDTVETACMVTLFVSCLGRRGWFELEAIMVIGLGVALLDVMGLHLIPYPNQAAIFYVACACLAMKHYSAPPAFVMFGLCVVHTGCVSAMLLMGVVGLSFVIVKLWDWRDVLVPIIGGVALSAIVIWGDAGWQHCMDALGRRSWQYPLAWDMICDAPWLGWGGGAYRWLQTTYILKECPLTTDIISVIHMKGAGMLHCDYLDALVSFGVVGVTLLLVVVGRALKHKHTPFEWIAVAVICFQAMIDLPFRSGPVVILAAVILARNDNEHYYHKSTS